MLYICKTLLIFASLTTYLTTIKEGTKLQKVMETKSVRKKIATMDIGESITFSLNEVAYSTLRSYGYTVGIETGNLYSTKVNRKERLLTVIRTA